MKNSAILKYSSGSKLLHWLIALIVILMLSGSFFLEDVPEAYQPSAYMMHKSFGLTVLMLMGIRVFWILYRGKPALPKTVPLWQKRVSRGVHYGFYVFLFAMPISGWILSVAEGRVPVYFGFVRMPLPIDKSKALAELMDQCHKTIAWVLIALVILHIAGAIKHYFIDKDQVLKRMLPRSGLD